MLITAIKIRKIQNTGSKLIGVVSITLDDMIAIHDIKVLKSTTGLFLAMPSRQNKSGNFKDIVHPISSSVRTAIETLIFPGMNYIDENHLSSIDISINKTEKLSLLEQKFEDFSIGSIKEGRFEDEISTPVLQDEKITSVSDDESDDFIKWLKG